jgi:hypothetical protein
LGNYLFGVARNLTRRVMQRSRLDLPIEEEWLDTGDAGFTSDLDVLSELSNSELLELLRKAVLALPEQYREVVALCDLEEMELSKMHEIDPQSGDPLKDAATDARLSEALRGLAASSGRGAPLEIGAGLATAFRRHHARRRLVRQASIGTLAACLTLAAGLISLRSRHEAPARKTVQEQPRAVHVETPEAVSVAKAVTTPPRPVKKHATTKATNSNLTAASRQFLALPGYDPAIPAEQLSIVRVRLPASALWQMGAPVSPDSGARKFMADFVVSQDGTPYAVRLVQ